MNLERRLIHVIADEDRWRAATLVGSWGYPRPISPREVAHGRWFENGAAIAWFIAPLGPDTAPPAGWNPEGLAYSEILAVHAIGKPELRHAGASPMLSWRSQVALEVIGELLGARKLYSLIPHEVPGMRVAAMRRYLRRFGWQTDAFGSWKQLGE